MKGARSRPVLLDVLEEHLEELEYLWEWREASVFSETMTAEEMEELEERAEAHLDGLLIGESAALDLARPKLTESLAEAAAAGLLLLSAGLEEDLAAAVEGLSSPEAPVREAWRIAWRHAATAAQLERLEGALPRAIAEPALRDLLVDILSFHRRSAPPATNKWLAEAEGASLGVLAAAAGRWGGPWSRDLLERTLASGSEMVAEAGLVTSARLGLPGLGELCRRSLAGPRLGALVEMAGVLGDAEDLPLLEALARSGPEPMRGPALRALGRLGLPEAVGTLAECAADAALIPAALWAFRRITGEELIAEEAELEELGAEELGTKERSAEEPGAEEPGAEVLRERESDAKTLGAEESGAEVLRERESDAKTLGAEEPGAEVLRERESDTKALGAEESGAEGFDPEEIRRRWQEIASRFAPGVRHQAGIALNEEERGAQLDTLPLGARRDAYLRVRARAPEALPDLELEARIALQRRQWGG